METYASACNVWRIEFDLDGVEQMLYVASFEDAIHTLVRVLRGWGARRGSAYSSDFNGEPVAGVDLDQVNV